MYRDMPSLDAEKSSTGIPWNARFLVMSKLRSASVVRFIEPGTCVRNRVAGHQDPSSHCIC